MWILSSKIQRQPSPPPQPQESKATQVRKCRLYKGDHVMLAWHEVLTYFTAWHEILTNISDHRLEKPPPRIASLPISIYFEFRGKPSLNVTFIWMDPHSPNKLIATKYCFSYSGMIPVSFFYVMLFISYYKFLQKIFIIIILIFFSWTLIQFFHVPEFSVFLVLSTAMCKRWPA